MMHQSLEMDVGKTLHCLEVLDAVQTDSRTSGWYWGDVRGRASIGAATTALWRRDLICSRVGPPPFQLTPKGEVFLKTQWNSLGGVSDQHESSRDTKTLCPRTGAVARSPRSAGR